MGGRRVELSGRGLQLAAGCPDDASNLGIFGCVEQRQDTLQCAWQLLHAF